MTRKRTRNTLECAAGETAMLHGYFLQSLSNYVYGYVYWHLFSLGTDLLLLLFSYNNMLKNPVINHAAVTRYDF